MKRVLITGGTGFFGQSFLDYRKRRGLRDEWIVLSRSPEAFRRQRPELAEQEGVSFVTGDVRDLQKLADLIPAVDEIWHFATPAVPDLPDEEMISIVVDGTKAVIDYARGNGCPKILFSSSGAVYGPCIAPSKEEDACAPMTAYGRGKLAAEKLLAASGLDVKIARCFAFTGPFLNREIHYAIGNFIADCLSGRDIIVKGDGTPRRSYLYADDLVEWLLAISARGISGRPYNVGSPEQLAIGDVALRVKSALESPVGVRVLGTSPASVVPSVYVPDVTRAMRELGVRVRVGFDDAVRRSAGRRRYVICVPHRTGSAGVRMLERLKEELVGRGYVARLFLWQDPPADSDILPDEITPEMREHDLVVYPEIVRGNPLGFRNVVRWVLNTPGVMGGRAAFGAGERLFAWNRTYHATAPLLRFDTVDHSLFYFDPSVAKDLVCTFVYKGGRKRKTPELARTTEISMAWPKTREELAALLRRTKVLYSHDDNSSLLDEAKACGAEIRLVTAEGTQDYRPVDAYERETFERQMREFLQVTQEMDNCGAVDRRGYYESCPRWALTLILRLFPITRVFLEQARAFSPRSRSLGRLLRRRYDLVVPIGSDCANAMYLRDLHLREASYPLDWVGNWSMRIGQSARIIAGDFKDFLCVRERLVPHRRSGGPDDDERHDFYRNEENSLLFFHDFERGRPLKETYRGVQEKYRHRAERFYADVARAKSVLLVFWTRGVKCRPEELREALTLLRGRLGGKVDLLVIENAQIPCSCLAAGSGDGLVWVRGMTYDPRVHITLGNVRLCRKIYGAIRLKGALARWVKRRWTKMRRHILRNGGVNR